MTGGAGEWGIVGRGSVKARGPLLLRLLRQQRPLLGAGPPQTGGVAGTLARSESEGGAGAVMAEGGALGSGVSGGGRDGEGGGWFGRGMESGFSVVVVVDTIGPWLTVLMLVVVVVGPWEPVDVGPCPGELTQHRVHLAPAPTPPLQQLSHLQHLPTHYLQKRREGQCHTSSQEPPKQ